MTNKEILLKWIDTKLQPNIWLNQDNFQIYLGDTAQIFVDLFEYKFRKQMLERYLENPCEETIDKFLNDIQIEYVWDGNSKVEKRAINKVLIRFNKPIL